MTTAILERTEEYASTHNGGRRATDPERIARGLAWFGIGLGLAELTTPRGLARLIGVAETEETCKTLRAMGLREIASGVAILARPASAAGVWTRVAGDAIDLGLLGTAMRAPETNRGRTAAATAAVAAVTLLDVLTGRRLAEAPDGSARAARAEQGVHVVRAITVNRPPEEVYRFWRNLQNLPRFMAHLESVRVLDERRSHWIARAPAGRSVEWDAEIVEDRPGEAIAWRSLEGARVPNSGSVRFSPAPGGRGTEIRVELRYDPPAGGLGVALAKLTGEEPGQQVDADLRRFKQVMEVGEVIHSDASIHHGMHPARPTAGAFDPAVVSAEGGMPS